MRIIGIDPGIGRTGWGVIEAQSSKIVVQSFGCIETNKDTKIEKRLQELYEQITAILRKEKPDAFAIEELFFNTNAKTAMVVGQARGISLLAAAQHRISTAVYTPLQVKIAVTGYGRAEKKQVGQMVKILLQLSEIPKPDDTADALAIAVTHAFSYKMK
ncbi:MAG TPA: crossover junction endodeoxyribonuclease RuvC [Candidatus Sulfotelmatobacter sp.]|jgi:crossover junction endodeoxyribonuclease RuvC|nr:crossover junction endodeoxyribonuclease RuvC [Candidatus Sulfotelmatobacter sp.]